MNQAIDTTVPLHVKKKGIGADQGDRTMFENFDFSPGVVQFCTDGLSSSPDGQRNLTDLVRMELRTEMCYVTFPNNLYIDVGWYPASFNESMTFKENFVLKQNKYTEEEDILKKVIFI